MVRRGRFQGCTLSIDDGSDQPVAAVYRGPIAFEGCAESVAALLRKSPARYKVHYLGPNEFHDVSKETLNKLDLFAWPGGGGVCRSRPRCRDAR